MEGKQSGTDTRGGRRRRIPPKAGRTERQRSRSARARRARRGIARRNRRSWGHPVPGSFLRRPRGRGRNGGGSREGKLFVILAGAALLCWLLASAAREFFLPGPQGEYLSIQEAENLTCLLAGLSAPDGEGRKAEEEAASLFDPEAASEDGYLIYETWEEIAALFPDCGYGLPEGYRNSDRVLLSDWYGFFDAALAVYDTRGEVQNVSLSPLGIGEAAADAEGEALAENRLVSADGTFYTFLTDRIAGCLYRPLTAVCRDGTVYAVRSVDGRELLLSNIWIMEAEKDELLCFWEDCEIRFPLPGQDGEGAAEENGAGAQKEREQVADLRFQDGVLREILTKTEKISGKILRVEEDGVEVEGSGFLPFADTLRIYRLYGKLKAYEKQDLRIGYDFTDFVLADGCVQAALVVKEETMENIRVLVRTTGFAGLYHDSVSVTADCELSLITDAYGQRETKVIPAGETLVIDRESGLFFPEEGTDSVSSVIRIEPAALTGRISLNSVQRSQGTPSYRGCLELRKEKEGIVVINELLLEEYLYAVVPSEMPASYPLEALKAQAVCARSYAYARILHAGLPEYGAHVDDSTGFQVYNNILENAQSTRAVRETKGELLYYGQELADTYYYSTSCGYGTDTSVWAGSGPDAFPYLQGKAVNAAGVTDAQGDAVDETVSTADIMPPDLMEQEESFSAFIKTVRASDFESREPWYRWTYQVDALSEELLSEKLRACFETAPSTVSVPQENGEEDSVRTLPDTGRVLELSITRRSAGGVAQTLRIVGEKATILVETENAIRTVLCDSSVPVIRMDGSSWQASTLLPSGFFVLEAKKENGAVTGYTLYGGGFGHGVGMSQNGAKNMAEEGCDCETILSYFYEGISLKKGNAQ